MGPLYRLGPLGPPPALPGLPMASYATEIKNGLLLSLSFFLNFLAQRLVD